MNTIRSFIALPLPADIIQELDRMIQFLKSKTEGVRWVKPNSIHLTIKFLADLSLPRRDAVIARLDSYFAANIPPFKLVVSGSGVFPNPRRPRVFWVGIGGSELPRLLQLQAGINEKLSEIDFASESRKFSPHLTLGRAKDIKNIAALMKSFQNYSLGEFDFFVKEVHLMRSELRPEGARYTIQKKYDLKTA